MSTLRVKRIRPVRPALACIALAVTAVTPAYATDIVVTSAGDGPEAGAGLTVREALARAQAAPGPDVVTLGGGRVALTDCAAGPLVIGGDDGVVLDGAGAELVQMCPGQPALRVTGDADIRRVTVTTTPGADAAAAVVTTGALWLRSSTITGATGPGVACTGCRTLVITGADVSRNAGGGVRVDAPRTRASITIRDSRITGNRSPGPGGGIAITGGGSRPSHTFIERTTISGNVAASTGGGGVASSGSDLYLSRSVVEGNTAGRDEDPASGGGVWFRAPERLPESGVSVVDSTVAGNTASLAGGGLSLTGGGTIRVIGTRVTGNTAGAQGGGIAVQANRPAAALVIDRSRIVGNSAGPASGGGGVSLVGDAGDAVATRSVVARNTAGRGGGLDVADRIGLTLTWSTLAGNVSTRGANAAVSGRATLTTLADIVVQGAGGAGCDIDAGATLVSRGYSLLDDATCGPSPSDLVTSADAGVMWSPAAGSGPATPDRLSPDSPAAGLVPASLCEGADISGIPRPQAACAAGAAEPVR